MSGPDDIDTASVHDQPSFLDFLVDFGMFVAVSFDPIASVAALQDERASEAASCLSRSTYLAIVRGASNDALAWPIPPPKPPLALMFFLVGQRAPPPPRSSAYVALFSPHQHPRGRAPVIPEPPLPWPEVYAYTIDKPSVRVTRIHTSNPLSSKLKDDQLLQLFKADMADMEAMVSTEQRLVRVALANDAPHPTSIGTPSAPEYDSGNSSGSASVTHEHRVDLTAEDGVDILLGATSPAGSSENGAHSDCSHSTQSSSSRHSHTDSQSDQIRSDFPSSEGSHSPLAQPPTIQPRPDGSSGGTNSEYNYSGNSDDCGVEPVAMRLHAEVWLDVTTAEFDDPSVFPALMGRLQEIEEEWRNRKASSQDMIAERSRTSEWVQKTNIAGSGGHEELELSSDAAMDHASVRRYSTFGLPSQRTLDYIKRVEVDQAHTSHNSPASHRRALSLPPKTRAEDWEEAQYARERDKTKLSFSARQDDIASWAPRWKQLGVTTERGTTTDSESDSVSSSVASQASRISAWMSDRQSEASKTSLSSHWDTSSATSSTSQYDVLSRTGTCEPDEYQEWRTHAPIVGYSDASRLPPSQRAVARPRPIDSSDTNFSVIQDGEEADHVSPSAPLRSTGDPSIDEPLAAVMTRPQVLVFTPQNAHVTNALILHNHVQLLGYELHWHERPFRNQWKSLALIDSVAFCEGVGRSKQAARQAAAGMTLEYLKENPQALPSGRRV